MSIDIEVLKSIARDAGSAIMAIYDNDGHDVEYKDDNSPLTAADKASHNVIVEGLQKHFPDIPILSEEGADIPYTQRKNWTHFWLVDPLDGTKEFIKRNGEFTVNIALIDNQQPVLGVVYVPAQDKLYYGIVGEGAWLQSKLPVCSCQEADLTPEVKTESCKLTSDDDSQTPIHVRHPDYVKGLTVVMSRSHPSPEVEDFLKDINVAEALPVGSSLKLCVVAEGKADLYPRLGPTMEWDTAAGHAVVLAACGSIVNLEGDPLIYNKESLLNPFFVAQAE